MRSTTRFLALGLAGFMLAACGNKDKNAPLAFVPADTPYVMANLDVLDDATRKAMLTQADAQFPAQLEQMDAVATQMADSDPDGARLLHALVKEFHGKTIEASAGQTGFSTKGYFALYGVGMAPVMRAELSDAKVFDAFIARLETAYGKPLDSASLGEHSYRRHVFAASGTQAILATIDQQAVAALLPAEAEPALLRQVLGLDRPQKSLQDDGRLATLAKTNGYQKWLIGQIDMTRALPLALGGTDPLVNAMLKAHAVAESAKTGEPVANQLHTAPSCAAEASRIAARAPSMSFGYTRLDPKHQDARFDLRLATDISQAFAGLKVALPGLGQTGTAPFDLSLALPVEPLRTFWAAQAEAVAATPFSCPALTDFNETFAKLGPAMQKAAIPPFGDMLGLRIALDTLVATPASSLPTFTGRLVLASNNPVGLFALGQSMVPSLAQLKLTTDGKPLPLPKDLAKMLGQPAWLAMTDKTLSLGIGDNAETQLAKDLTAPTGDAGRMARMHLSGAMYLSWLQLMEDKVDTLAAATAAMSKSDEPSLDADADGASTQAAIDHSRAQFAAMKNQAERINALSVEMHVDDNGMVISSQTELK